MAYGKEYQSAKNVLKKHQDIIVASLSTMFAIGVPVAMTLGEERRMNEQYNLHRDYAVISNVPGETDTFIISSTRNDENLAEDLGAGLRKFTENNQDKKFLVQQIKVPDNEGKEPKIIALKVTIK